MLYTVGRLYRDCICVHTVYTFVNSTECPNIQSVKAVFKLNIILCMSAFIENNKNIEFFRRSTRNSYCTKIIYDC